MRALIFVAALSSCVKGNPVQGDPTFNGVGGTLAISGCSYSVTTPAGVEPPTAASSFVGMDPTPRLLHLGLVGDPRSSVVVQWRTTDETTLAGEVHYGVGSALDQTASSYEFAFKPTGMELYRQHQAHLCGLQPGTTYSYQVVSGGQTSPVYQFHTMPDVSAHPDAEVVLGFVGDSRGGYDVWQQLVAQLQQRMPDMILFSGDAVTIGITQYEWEDFFARAEPLFATTPVIAANGNHEGNAPNFYAQMALPGDQQNFGVDLGFAHVTVGNDTPDDPAAITGAFRDAIDADMTASEGARWKIFMHHQPIWSSSTRHGSSVTLQQAWQPIVDKHHIDLVLNGHDHDYEVTKPLVGMTVQSGAAAQNATVYVVAGGAGAELYPNGNQFFTDYSESTYSAALLHIRHDTMTFDAFRPDGTSIPTGFSKTKP